MRGLAGDTPRDVSFRIAQRSSCTLHRENARAILRRSPAAVNGSSGLTGDQVSGTGWQLCPAVLPVLLLLLLLLLPPSPFGVGVCPARSLGLRSGPVCPLPSIPFPSRLSPLVLPCCSCGRVLLFSFSLSASFGFPLSPSLSGVSSLPLLWFGCASFLWCSGASLFSPLSSTPRLLSLGLVWI